MNNCHPCFTVTRPLAGTDNEGAKSLPHREPTRRPECAPLIGLTLLAGSMTFSPAEAESQPTGAAALPELRVFATDIPGFVADPTIPRHFTAEEGTTITLLLETLNSTEPTDPTWTHDESRFPEVELSPPHPVTGAVTFTLPERDEDYTFSLVVSASQGTGVRDARVTIDTRNGICGRTPQVREALLERIPEAATCAHATRAQLANLSGSLNIGDVGVAAPTLSDFAGLVSVEQLSLESGSIEALPANLFRDMQSLRQLNLRSNRLATLPEGILGGLDSLRTLDLRANRFEAVPRGLFRGAPNLRQVLLDDNPGDFALEVLLLGGTRGGHGVILAINEGAPTDIPLLLKAGGRTFPTLFPAGRTVHLASLPADLPRGNGDAETMVALPAQSPRLPDGPASDGGPDFAFGELRVHAREQRARLSGIPPPPAVAAISLPSLREDEQSPAREPLLSMFSRPASAPLSLRTADASGSTSGFSSASTAQIVFARAFARNVSGSHTIRVTSGTQVTLTGHVVTSFSSQLDIGWTSADGIELEVDGWSEAGWSEAVFDAPATPGTYTFHFHARLLLAGFFTREVVTVHVIPALSLTASPDPVLEGDEVVVTITSDPAPVSDLLTSVLISGGGSYQIAGGERTSTFPAGETTRFLRLRVGNNSARGEDATLTVALNREGGYGLNYAAGSPDRVHIPLWDDDRPRFTVRATEPGWLEARPGAPHEFEVEEGTRVTLLPERLDPSRRGLVEWTPDASNPASLEDEDRDPISGTFSFTLPEPSGDYLIHLTESGEVEASARTTLTLSVSDGICGRSALAREKILEALRSSDCAEVTRSRLRNFEGGVYIPEERTGTLKKSDFAFLESLRVLEIGAPDGMTTLPVGIFSELESLRDLKLTHFESLPPGLFRGLDTLERLFLRSNDFSGGRESLPPGVFEGLGSVTSFELSYSQLPGLDSDQVEGLGPLTQLYLWSNPLTSLPEDFAERFRTLNRFSLSRSHLDRLPAGAFDHMEDLTQLYLTGNRFTGFPAAVSNARALVRLDLSNNDIASLPGDAFANLASLEQLILQGNQLAELPAGMFRGLTRLKEVDLRRNPGTPFALEVVLGVNRFGDRLSFTVAEGAPVPFSVQFQAQIGAGWAIPPPSYFPVGETRIDVRNVYTTPGRTVRTSESTRDLPGGAAPGGGNYRFLGFEVHVAEQRVTLPGALIAGVEVAAGDNVRAGSSENHFFANENTTITLTAAARNFNAAADSFSWSQTPSWNQVGGDAAPLVSGSEASGNVLTLELPNRSADYTVNLRASTNAGGTNRHAEVVLVVNAADDPPRIADAPPPRASAPDVPAATSIEVLAGTEVTLSGSATEPDTDQSLTLAWSGGPGGGALTDHGDGTATFVSSEAGDWNFTFTAGSGTQPGGARDTRTVRVKRAHLVSLTPAIATVEEGEEVTFTVTSTPPPTRDLRVAISISGGEDFGILNGVRRVTIGQGDTAALLRWQTAEDNRAGEDAFLNASLEESSGYFIDSPGAGGVLLLDDDVSALTVRGSGTPALGEAPGPFNWFRAEAGTRVTLTAEAPTLSGTVDYTWSRDDSGAVSLNFDPAALDSNELAFTLPERDEEYTLLLTANAASGDEAARARVAVIATNNICGRSAGARAALIDSLVNAGASEVDDCRSVTRNRLREFEGPLELPADALAALEPGDLLSLDALTSLILHGRDGLTVPSVSLFEGLSAITTVELREFDILPRELLQSFSALTTLTLRDSRVADDGQRLLPANAFRELETLTTLDLSGNRLAALEDDLFTPLSRLQTLKLGDNRFTQLPAAARGIGSLVRLDLEGNDIASLPTEAFARLNSLTHLNLRGNRIASLPPDLFKGVNALTQLDLEENPGAPFTVKLVMGERPGGDGVALAIVEGAPTTLSVHLTADRTNAVPVSFPAGSTREVVGTRITLPQGAPVSIFDRSLLPPDGAAPGGGEYRFRGLEVRSIARSFTLPAVPTPHAAIAAVGNIRPHLTRPGYFLSSEGETIELVATGTQAYFAKPPDSFSWRHASDNPAPVLPEEPLDGDRVQFTLPDRSHDYTVRLRVATRGSHPSATTNVFIIVEATDAPVEISSAPRASATGGASGSDLKLPPGVEVTLTGSASDADVDQTPTLTWTAPADVALTDRGDGAATFTSPAPGDYTFTFAAAVTGGENGDVRETRTVRARVRPRLSVTASAADVEEGGEVLFTISADPPTPNLNVHWYPRWYYRSTVRHSFSPRHEVAILPASIVTVRRFQIADNAVATGNGYIRFYIGDRSEYIPPSTNPLTIPIIDDESPQVAVRADEATGVRADPDDPRRFLAEEGSTVTLVAEADDTLPAPVSYSWERTGWAPTGLTLDEPDGDRLRITLPEPGAGYEVTLNIFAGSGQGRATATVTATLVATDGICKRSPAVRESLLDAIAAAGGDSALGCADVTGAQLRSLEELVLDADGASGTLRPGDFARLDSLSSLTLRGLGDLPDGTFHDLGALATLELENFRGSVSRELFRGLDALTTLGLTGSDLSDGAASLPPDTFDDLDSLTSLDLSDNRLATLDRGLIEHLDRLEHLSLADNPISPLPPDFLQPLGALKRLNLADTGLETIDPRLFAGLNLQSLELARNRIADLPEGIFRELTALETLDLADNRIRVLPGRLFWELTELRSVGLEGNLISYLPDGLFQQLAKLNRFDLERNPGAPFALEITMQPLPGGAGALLILPKGAPTALSVDTKYEPSANSGDFEPFTIPSTIAAGNIHHRQPVFEAYWGSTLSVEAHSPSLPAVTAPDGKEYDFGGLEARVLPARFDLPATPTRHVEVEVRDETVLTDPFDPTRFTAPEGAEFEIYGVGRNFNDDGSSPPLRWTQAAGDPVRVLSGESDSGTSLRLVLPDRSSNYTLNLRVVAEGSVPEVGTDITVVVEATDAPVEIVGAPQASTEGAAATTHLVTTVGKEVELSGSAVDADTDQTPVLAWSGPDGIDIDDREDGTATFTPSDLGEHTFTFTATVSSSTNGLVVTTLTRTVNVRVVPRLSLAVSEEMVDEGGELEFTVTVEPAPTADFHVPVTLSGGEDFGIATGTRMVTVEAGASTAVRRLQVRDDLLETGDATLTLSIEDRPGHLVESPADLTVTLRDEEELRFSFEIAAPDWLEKVNDPRFPNRFYVEQGATLTLVTEAIGFPASMLPDWELVPTQPVLLPDVVPGPDSNTFHFTPPEHTRIYNIELTARATSGGRTVSDSLTLVVPVGICRRSRFAQEVLLYLVQPGWQRNLSNCAKVTRSHLEEIELFELWPGENTIEAGDFDGLESVTELSIRGESSMTTLPVGVFDGLPSLTTLNFFGTLFRSLPRDLFRELDGLETLNIQGNLFNPGSENLPAGLFDGLDALTGLSLASNQLYEVDGNLLRGLGALTSLDLSGNRLDELEPSLFDDLGQLESLSLADNQFTAASLERLDGLDTLTRLYLNENRIATLPRGALENLPRLEVLDLSDNDFTAFPDHLSAAPRLTRLDLADNRIEALPVDAFAQLSPLTGIDFSGNQLTTLPAGAFAQLSTLTGFDFSGNAIESLPAGLFEGATGLTGFALDGNPGAPFALEVTMHPLPGGDGVVFALAEGAPADLPLALTIGANSAVHVLPAGQTRSFLRVPEDLPQGATVTLAAQALSLPTGTAPNGEEYDFSGLEVRAQARSITLPDAFVPHLAVSVRGEVRLDPADATRFLVREGAELSFTASAEYFDAAPAFFRWAQAPDDAAPVTLASSGPVAELTLPNRSTGYTVNLSVSAGGGTVDTSTAFALVVEAADDPVRIVDDPPPRAGTTDTPAGTAIAVAPGAEVTLTGRAIEPDLDQRIIARWSGPENISLSDHGDGSASFTANEDGEFTFTFSVTDGDGAAVENGTRTASVRIAPPVSLAVSSLVVNEGETVTLTVSTSPAPEDYLDVFVSISGGEDFAIGNGTAIISIEDGETTATHPLPTVDDGVETGDATLIVSLVNGPGYAVGPESTFTIALRDREEPRIQVRAGAPAWVATAPGEPHRFIIEEGTTVTLVPEAHLLSAPVTYAWEQDEADIVRLTNLGQAQSTGAATFTLPERDADYTVHLTVRATSGERTIDTTVTVTVANGICDRSAMVRDRLVSALGTPCADITRAQLGGFNPASFVVNPASFAQSVRRFRPGDFAGLTSLTSLTLRDWRAGGSPPAGLFDDLRALTTLELIHNRFTRIPEDLFSRLGALENLVLSDNTLGTVPAGLFRELGSLRNVNLWSNGLSSLPAGLFDGLGQLEELRLGSNDLSALPENLFRDLDRLRVLSLELNQLKEWPSAIDPLVDLTHLELNQNRFESLPAHAFQGMEQLQMLDLAYNPFTTLPVAINNAVNLTHLYLETGAGSRNPEDRRIASIPENAFEGMERLQEVLLGDHRLTTLPVAINNAVNLRELDVDNNEIASLPVGLFEGMDGLPRIYLDDNPGAPFILEVTMERLPGGDGVVFAIAQGTPADIPLDLTIGASRVTHTFPAGHSRSVLRAPEDLPWRSTVTLAAQASALPTGPAPSGGNYVFDELEVRVAEQSVTLSDAPVPHVAVVADGDVRGDPTDVTRFLTREGGEVSLTASANHFTVAPESFSWIRLPGDAGQVALDTSTSTAQVTLPNRSSDYIVNLRVMSNMGTPDARVDVSLAVAAEDDPLQIEAVAASADKVSPETEVTLTGDATDPDRDQSVAVGWSGPEGVVLTADGDGAASFTAPAPGDYTFTFTAIATRGNGSVAERASGTVSVRVVPRVSLAASSHVADEGGSVGLTVTAEPAPTADLEVPVSVTGAEDFGLADGAVTVTIGAGEPHATYRFTTLQNENETGDATLVATLEEGAEYVLKPDSGVVSITLRDDERPQVGVLVEEPAWIEAAPDALHHFTVEEGTVLTLVPAASRLSAPVNYAWEQAADDSVALDLDDPDPASGALSFTLPEQGGDYTVHLTVRATSQSGADASADVTLVVGNGICARSPAVRAALTGIIIVNGSSADCEEVTRGQLRALEGALTVEGDALALKPGDFADLEALASLTLTSEHGTTALPVGVFDGLAALTILELRYHSLAGVPADLFRGLDTLIALALRGNTLGDGPDSLPANLFNGLSSLETLEVLENGLNSVPPDLFQGLSALTTLHLGGNHFGDEPGALPAEIFNGLSALTELSLWRNRLTSMPAGLFDGLGALESLDLGNNDFVSLPENAFTGLSALVRLELNRNELETLPAGIFDLLSGLSFLNLDGNAFTAFPTAIMGAGGLERLSLSNNDIASLLTEAFANLPELTELELYNNELSLLPAGLFEGATGLTQVDLEGNPGAPFTLEVTLHTLPGGDGVALALVEGAPADILLTLTIGATSSAHIFPAGETRLVVRNADLLPQGATVTMEEREQALPNGTGANGAASSKGPYDFDGLEVYVEERTLSLPDERAPHVEITAGGEVRPDPVDATRFLAREGASLSLTANARFIDIASSSLSWAQRADDVVPVLSGAPVAGNTLALTLPHRSGTFTVNLNVTGEEDGPATSTEVATDIVLVVEAVDDPVQFDDAPRAEAPNIPAAAAVEVPIGTRVTLIGSAREPDADQRVAVAWSNAQGVTPSPDGVGRASYIANDSGEYLFTFTALVTGADGAVAERATRTVTVWIVPRVSLAVSSDMVNEGGEVTFTVTRERASIADLDVFVSLTGGERFGIGNATTTVTIPARETTATHRLTTRDDDVETGDATLTLKLEDGTGYVVDTSSSPAIVALRDEELARVNVRAAAPAGVATTPGAPHRFIVEEGAGVTLVPEAVLLPAPVSYAWAQDAQDSVFLDLGDQAAGAVSFTLPERDADYTVHLTVLATSGGRTVSTEVTLVALNGICGRSPVVRAALESALGASSCADITRSELRGLNREDFSLSPSSAEEATGLKAGDFADLTSLSSLKIHDWSVRAPLPAGLFDDLRALRSLAIVNTRFTSIPEGLLRELGALEELALRYNSFTLPPAGLFEGLDSLTSLDLSHSGLSSLPDGMFDGLSGLEVLLLTDNRLVDLPENAFRGLGNLRELDLRDNRLTSAPAAIDSLTRLAHLLLEGNDIALLREDAFQGLDRLQELTLARNRFTSLPVAVNNAPGLQRITLEENDISLVPDDAFRGLNRLEEVQLHQNRLQVLPAALGNAINLKRITLHDNDIVVVPDDAFRGLSRLAEVSLSRNRLTLFPAALREATRLESLQLRENEIAELPADAFRSLPLLRHVDLHGNRIAELPAELFRGLEHLTTLVLDGNPGQFTLDVEMNLTPQGDGVVFTLAEGAPADLALNLTLPTGASSTSIFPAGRIRFVDRDSNILAQGNTVTLEGQTQALPDGSASNGETFSFRGLQVRVARQQATLPATALPRIDIEARGNARPDPDDPRHLFLAFENERIELVATAANFSPSPVSFSWTQMQSDQVSVPLETDAAGNLVALRLPAHTADYIVNLRLDAQQEGATTTSTEVLVVVNAGGDAVRIDDGNAPRAFADGLLAGPNLRVSPGVEVTLSGGAVSDLTPLVLAWSTPDNIELTDHGDGTATSTPSTLGVYLFTFTATGGEGDMQRSATSTVTVSVVPRVTLTTAASSTLTEGNEVAFTLHAAPAPEADLDVTVWLSGGAGFGIGDGPRTVTIPRGEAMATERLPTVNDDIAAANATLSLSLEDAPTYVAGRPGRVTFTIEDDDEPRITVVARDDRTTTSEDGDTITLEVTLASAPTSDVELVIESSDPGEGEPGLGNLTFTPGNWSDTRIVEVVGENDDFDDGNQDYWVYFLLTTSDVRYASEAPLPIQATNEDDDPTPNALELAFGVADTADEDGLALSVIARLRGGAPLAEAGTVIITMTTASAASGASGTGADLSLSTSTVAIPAGQASGEATLPLALPGGLEQWEGRRFTMTGTHQLLGLVDAVAINLVGDSTPRGISVAPGNTEGFIATGQAQTYFEVSNHAEDNLRIIPNASHDAFIATLDTSAAGGRLEFPLPVNGRNLRVAVSERGGDVAPARSAPRPAGMVAPRGGLRPMYIEVEYDRGALPVTQPVSICLPFNQADGGAPTLYHLADGAWETQSLGEQRVDEEEGHVCGETTTFSLFAVFQEAPPGTIDLNGDGAVDANDALILYYATSLRSVLGSGR